MRNAPGDARTLRIAPPRGARIRPTRLRYAYGGTRRGGSRRPRRLECESCPDCEIGSSRTGPWPDCARGTGIPSSGTRSSPGSGSGSIRRGRRSTWCRAGSGAAGPAGSRWAATEPSRRTRRADGRPGSSPASRGGRRTRILPPPPPHGPGPRWPTWPGAISTNTWRRTASRGPWSCTGRSSTGIFCRRSGLCRSRGSRASRFRRCTTGCARRPMRRTARSRCWAGSWGWPRTRVCALPARTPADPSTSTGRAGASGSCPRRSTAGWEGRWTRRRAAGAGRRRVRWPRFACSP